MEPSQVSGLNAIKLIYGIKTKMYVIVLIAHSMMELSALLATFRIIGTITTKSVNLARQTNFITLNLKSVSTVPRKLL